MIKAGIDAPGAQTAVSDKISVLLDALTDRVKTNLSSKIPEAGTAAISAAILASFEGHNSNLFISIPSSGAEVAAIQELGGKLAASKHLQGEQHFGPAKPMRSRRASLHVEKRDALASDFKQAILEALGQR